jgi:PTS system nitrogen regulatory IIA component
VDDRLLTPDEVAAILQVSPEWVRESARRGDIPSVKLGHYRRFKRSDVDVFIESRKTVVTSR